MEKDLVGAKGIIYLMFVGTETKAYDVMKTVVKTGIVKKNATVYGCVNKLEGNYIETIRIENKPGNPRIRKAKLDAIFETAKPVFLRLYSPLKYRDCEEKFEKVTEKLEFLLKNTGALLSFFPNFLTLSLKERNMKNPQRVKNLQWKEILYIYLRFCERLIFACWCISHFGYWIPKLMNKNEEKKPGEIYFLVPTTDVALDKYINEKIREKKISPEEISRIANLTDDPMRDRYEPQTFLRNLWLIDVGLEDPELATNLDSHLEGARMHGNQQMSTIIYREIEANSLNVPLRELAKTHGEKTLSEVIMEILANQKVPTET